MNELADDLAGVPDEAKVFLSYSRKDRERAQSIADALRSRHFGVFKDTDDILPTEEWKDRLQQLIEEADTIVFLLSPHSATSEVCAWEVEYATSLNKRIAPIVIEDTEASDIPPLLAQLNFIFCTPRDPFDNAVDTLASALSTDIDWIREHTRLAGLARRWRGAGAPARLLLRGQDINDAEQWRDGRPRKAPEVTAAQAGFIDESRKATGRRQRNWIAGSLTVAAGAIALSIFAYLQSVEANFQRVEAEAQRSEAERQRDDAVAARAEAEEARIRAEEQRALAEIRLREALIARTRRNLADTRALLEDGRERPAAAEVLIALDTARDLDDTGLIRAAEAMGRRLLSGARALGWLEGTFDTFISPDVSSSGATRAVMSRQSGDLDVWSLDTGHRTIALTEVNGAAFRADGAVFAIHTRFGHDVRTAQTGMFVVALDARTGAAIYQTRHPAPSLDAWTFPEAGLALVYASDNGRDILLGVDMADGAFQFEIPMAERPVQAVGSMDGRFALVFEGAVVRFDARGIETGRADIAGVDQVRRARRGYALKAQDGWIWWADEAAPRVLSATEGRAEHLVLIGDGRAAVLADIDDAALIALDGSSPPEPLATGPLLGLVAASKEPGLVITRGFERFGVHDAASGDLIRQIGRASPPTGGFSASSDGRYLAIVHQDGLVTVWSTESGRELLAVRPGPIDGGGAVWIQLIDGPTGPTLAAIDEEGSMSLWRVEPLDIVFGGDSDRLTGPDALMNGALAALGPDGALEIWDIAARAPRKTIEGASHIGSDPAMALHLLRLGQKNLAIATSPERPQVPLEDAPLYPREIAWGDGRVAFYEAGVVLINDTETGESLARLDLFTDDPPEIVRDMTFVGEHGFAILPGDGRLLIGDVASGEVSDEHALSFHASRMVAGRSGALLIEGDGEVWRFSAADGALSQLRAGRPFATIIAAGAHAALIQAGDPDTRDVWMVDVATGEKRFETPFGSAFALGDADRIVAAETARGAIWFLDAQTGETLLSLPEDGGVGPSPRPPLLSADETTFYALNGATELFRVISTETGDLLASAPRHSDGDVRLNVSANGSTAAIAQDLRIGAADLSMTGLGGEDLSRAIGARYPVAPVPADGPEPTRCDRLASFGADPFAVADGIDFDDIEPAALDACGTLMSAGEPDLRTLFQFARAALRHFPEQDVQTIQLLEGLAEANYPAANHVLGYLTLQGRVPGGVEAAADRLRRAAAAGMSASSLLLVTLAQEGFLDEEPEALISGDGAEILSSRAARSANEGRLSEAATLARRAAIAYAGRRQRLLSETMTKRAGNYAARVPASQLR